MSMTKDEAIERLRTADAKLRLSIKTGHPAMLTDSESLALLQFVQRLQTALRRQQRVGGGG